METIGVIGAGQMGSGIAQVAAAAGFSVQLIDLQPQSIEKSKASIQKSLNKLESKGKLEGASQVFSRIEFSDDLQNAKKCNWIIEAIIEDEEKKAQLFQQLHEITPKETIFASNTSSISITRLGAKSGRPQQFLGLHFMNPVPLMSLVEVISSVATSTEVLDQGKRLVEKMDKFVVESQDYPGFVVNRILMPMINEAFQTWQEGVSSPESIDEAMRRGTNQPMGPLQLADFIGLDTCLAIIRVLYDGFKDPRYRPSAKLVQLVDAGWYGRKVGRGVYKYD